MLLVHAVSLLFTFLSSRGDIHLNVMCTVNAATYIYFFFPNLKSFFSGFYRSITHYTHAHKLKSYLRYGKLTISDTKSSHRSLYLRRRSFCACHWRLAPLHHIAWHTNFKQYLTRTC